ncbi:hypothetical protein [Chitinophaga eiseniae]|uniref:Uncharacterized protein n=1 Tax=Chitinophaga eiseniae TaxID=634771 RepID=A0A847SR37_9BACT|nr:hypothetical protein [Chitinophaga eiseniae]NLR79946.1 hypothetical protein [Chitinophaga eiseniae]
MTTNILVALKCLAEENPKGFTVYVPSLEPVKRGWVVAKIETQNSFGDEGLERVLKYATATTGIVGYWNDDGTFYWDAVMVFDNEAEATAAGIANEQIAIYNIGNNELKML